MRGMCNTCEKILVCKKLCPEAEKYANQDYVPAMEGLAIIRIENFNDHDSFGHDKVVSINLDNPAVLKRAIILLYLDGKSTRKIAEYVPCSRRYIREIIYMYKEQKIQEVGSNSKKDN